MSAWALLAVLGLVSLALRSVVVLTSDRFELPDAALAWCSLLGPAIVAALLGGSLATTLGGQTPLRDLAPLAAGAVVTVRSGSTGAGLAAGLAAHLLVLAIS